MDRRLHHIITQIVPFLTIGVSIALIIGIFIFLSYVLVWGIALGLILWLIVTIKNYFFPGASQKPLQGRIIEHEHRRK